MNRFVFSAALVVGLAPAFAMANDSAPAPTFAPQLKPGDHVRIATAGAALVRGSQTLGTLEPGQGAVVAELREPWVGVYVQSGDESQSGWIRLSDLIPASAPRQAACPASPVAYTVAYPPPVQSTTAATAVAAGVVASRPARDPFLIGRYERFENDPNMHVWEPWRR